MNRVLSLDGGGLKGIYTLRLMQRLTDEKVVNFNHDFDIFAGTSIGGLIAVCLATKMSPKQILELFEVDSYIALSDTKKAPFNFFKQNLFEKIEQQFGNILFESIKHKVFLPVFNLTDKTQSYFDRNCDKFIDQLKVSDVLKAICSDIRVLPPFYIDTLNKHYCDAGLFAYDPSVFFIQNADLTPQSGLKILSIGSGIIENISDELNMGEKFDLLYDTFLDEQFKTTQYVFDLLSEAGEVDYVRLSEYPNKQKIENLEQLVELADKRFDSLNLNQISSFI